MENTFTNISLDCIKTKLEGKSIHSIAYNKQDYNNLEITAYTPNKLIILGFPDLVTAQQLTFNLSTAKLNASVDKEKFPQNILSHNLIHIMKTDSTITGYERHEDKTTNDYLTTKAFPSSIVKKGIKSCALQPNNINEPIIAAGFENETHLHNLNRSNPEYIFKHQGSDSTALAFDNDGKQFLTGTSNGNIQLYSLTSDPSHEKSLLVTFQRQININPVIDQKKVEITIEKEVKAEVKTVIETNNSWITTLRNSLSFKNLWKTTTALAAFGLIYWCYIKHKAQSAIQ